MPPRRHPSHRRSSEQQQPHHPYLVQNTDLPRQSGAGGGSQTPLHHPRPITPDNLPTSHPNLNPNSQNSRRPSIAPNNRPPNPTQSPLPCRVYNVKAAERCHHVIDLSIAIYHRRGIGSLNRRFGVWNFGSFNFTYFENTIGSAECRYICIYIYNPYGVRRTSSIRLNQI